MPAHKQDLQKRFFKYVNKTESCWLWIGAKLADGYGAFWMSKANSSARAHRVSWLIHNGYDAGELRVCHRCDNPLCVNPDHLFLGTQSDNVQDAARKHRMASGPRNGHAVLTENDVKAIREIMSSENAPTQSWLAKYLKVDARTIARACRKS